MIMLSGRKGAVHGHQSPIPRWSPKRSSARVSRGPAEEKMETMADVAHHEPVPDRARYRGQYQKGEGWKMAPIAKSTRPAVVGPPADAIRVIWRADEVGAEQEQSSAATPLTAAKEFTPHSILSGISAPRQRRRRAPPRIAPGETIQPHGPDKPIDARTSLTSSSTNTSGIRWRNNRLS
jgi:hypothetical protein